MADPITLGLITVMSVMCIISSGTVVAHNILQTLKRS